MLNYFQANSGESLGTEVNLAKAVFIQNGYNITEYYRSAAKELINSELISVNFKMNGAQAQQTINQYVFFINYLNKGSSCYTKRPLSLLVINLICVVFYCIILLTSLPV